MTFVNCVSVRLSEYLGYVFNLGKIAGLMLIMVLGMYGLFLGRILEKKFFYHKESV